MDSDKCGNMFYSENSEVYCPFSRSQCNMHCPLVKQENTKDGLCYKFYCGTNIPTYKAKHIDFDSINK